MSYKKTRPSSKKTGTRRKSARTRSSGTRKRPSPRAQRKPTLDERLVEIAAPLQKEIAGVVIVIFGALTLLALMGLLPGTLAPGWKKALQQAFGWGSWVMAFSVIFAGLHLALRSAGRPWRITAGQIIGFEIAFVISLALSHITSAKQEETALALAAAGRGGGYIGWALSVPLVDGVGMLLAWLMLSGVWLFGVGLLFRVSRHDAQKWILNLSAGMQTWADGIRQKETPVAGAPPAPPPTQRPPPARK